MKPAQTIGNTFSRTFAKIAPLLATAIIAVAPASAQTETVLHAFAGTDGAIPVGNLISDASGNLYGATIAGGLQNKTFCASTFGNDYYCGVIFELSKSSGGWTFNVLHEFTGGTDGGNPSAGLVLDAAGNLYGTAEFGGDCVYAYGCGVVFELSPTASGPWTETVLYSFQDGDDGGLPESQLVFDSAGNLYGTTAGGGTGSCGLGVPCGVVFELTPTASGTWSESVLYNFQGFSEGAEPTGPLVFDAKGNLYGTTSIGGSVNGNCGYPFYGCGTAFELSPNSSGGWTETELYIFTIGRGGAYPADAVMVDAAGTLYGTAEAGGDDTHFCGTIVFGCGVVYALKPNASSAWSESTVFSFSGGVSGKNPRRPDYGFGRQPVRHRI